MSAELIVVLLLIVGLCIALAGLIVGVRHSKRREFIILILWAGARGRRVERIRRSAGSRPL